MCVTTNICIDSWWLHHAWRRLFCAFSGLFLMNAQGIFVPCASDVHLPMMVSVMVSAPNTPKLNIIKMYQLTYQIKQ